MKQKEIFMEGGEGDAWFKRNLGDLGKVDPVTPAIVAAGIVPKYVLEVGCANGWRLNKLRDLFNCGVMGVEPSMAAGCDAVRLKVPVYQMTASCLPVTTDGYDMVIYAFCLYLTDPADWLTIAAEGDRVLAAGGHIVIHDFSDTAYGNAVAPYAAPYAHRDGLRSYHFNFASLWLAHPQYKQVIFHEVSTQEGVWIIRKAPVAESIPLVKR